MGSPSVPRMLRQANCGHCRNKYGQVPVLSYNLKIDLIVILLIIAAFVLQSGILLVLAFVPVLFNVMTPYSKLDERDYEEYDIWIRNVISKPKLSDNRNWTFWQFTNRDKLDGYKGKEKYIDVNVFHGSREEYDTYLKNNTYKTPFDR